MHNLAMILTFIKLFLAPFLIIIFFILISPEQGIYYAGGSIQIYGLGLVTWGIYKLNKYHGYDALSEIRRFINRIYRKLSGKKKDAKITGVNSTVHMHGSSGALTAEQIPDFESHKQVVNYLINRIKELESHINEKFKNEQQSREQQVNKLTNDINNLRKDTKTIDSKLTERSASEFRIEFSGVFLLIFGIALSTWSECISNWSLVYYIADFGR